MKLSDAIDAYLAENRALRDHTASTTRSYRQRIRTFQSFLDDSDIDITSALTKTNLVNYFNDLQDQGYAASTIYAKKQALRTLWHWAYSQKLLDEDMDIRIVHPPTSQTVYLEPGEKKRIELAAHVGDSRFSILHLRDEAAFELLVEMGIPISALSQLLRDDYDPHQHTLRINSCTVLLSDSLCAALDQYIHARELKENGV